MTLRPSNRTVILLLVAFGGACLLFVALRFDGSMNAFSGRIATTGEPRPPLTPRWAYEPWVWEDEENTAEAVRTLIREYRQHDIPVGTVIIDSPWQTNYNTFEFNSDYPDPASLVRELRGDGVRVILWATGFVNIASSDGPDRGKAALFDEAFTAGYLVDDGRTYVWDKGEGGAIDFFNTSAVSWWHRQMDRAFAMGVDGWKVDSPEGNLPDQVNTVAGLKTEREYGDAYYRAFYRHVAERNPEAIIMARAIDSGTVYAPLDVNPAAWVGDQNPSWAGLREAVDDVLASAERGYAVVGSDIGGYRRGERSADVFIRWAQFGALVPLMENGGRGEHRPWRYRAGVLETYRYYAKLHHELVPYLYSAGVVAHRSSLPIIRHPDKLLDQYELGDDLLVAPIITEDGSRDVTFPAGSRWRDYWSDDVVHEGGQTRAVRMPISQIPLYIRDGAMIPLQVDDPETGHGGHGSAGHLTVLMYPGGESTRMYYPNPEQEVSFRSRRTDTDVTVEISQHTERYVLRIKAPEEPTNVRLSRGGSQESPARLLAWSDFDQASEGWYYDAERRYLWTRFGTDQTGARVTYTFAGA